MGKPIINLLLLIAWMVKLINSTSEMGKEKPLGKVT